MSTRTITVKGVGGAVSRPDQITIPITLTARDMDYQQTMRMVTEQHETLKASLSACNIPAADIKTLDFNVNAHASGTERLSNNVEGKTMWGKSFFMHTAKAAKPRCYETTVDFHFARNADGQLIAVDNTTGRPIGQVVTMGETIAARKPLNSLLFWGSRAVRCASV